jgi:hypothetical protein
VIVVLNGTAEIRLGPLPNGRLTRDPLAQIDHVAGAIAGWTPQQQKVLTNMLFERI